MQPFIARLLDGAGPAGRRARLHELMPQQVSLEEAFMDLTRDDVEFHGPLATESTGTTVSSAAGATSGEQR